MIGIHHSKISYSGGWIDYCKANNIRYKIVDAYANSIIEDLEECDIFMWHFFHNNPKDVLFAKQLLFSLEQSGKYVFPNFKTCWHFDDKVGQKYLLESLKLPVIPSFIAYSKIQALNLLEKVSIPFVFKLRGGAGSYNVSLVKTKSEAIKLINKSFKSGFRQFNPYTDIKFAFNKIKEQPSKIENYSFLFKCLAHIVVPYEIEKAKGREAGYFYFQEFIPGLTFDYRVQFIGNKCYAMKRYVRKNDFRASGGGMIDYDGSKIPMEVIKMATEVRKKVDMQIMAIDILTYGSSYAIAEVSYAFAIDEGECDFGFYDNHLNWNAGVFNPYQWMIDLVLKRDNEK